MTEQKQVEAADAFASIAKAIGDTQDAIGTLAERVLLDWEELTLKLAALEEANHLLLAKLLEMNTLQEPLMIDQQCLQVAKEGGYYFQKSHTQDGLRLLLQKKL